MTEVSKLDKFFFQLAIWLSLGTLALLIWLTRGDVNPVRLTVVLALSMAFPLIAQCYHRFLIRTSQERREAEIDYLASRLKGQTGPTHVDAQKLKEFAKSEYSIRAYTLSLIPVVAASIIGWSILLEPVSFTGSKGTLFLELTDPVATAMGIGFIGSLVFSLQMIWQRVSTEDLKPSVFLRCSLALFCGLAFTFVVFSATQSFVDGLGIKAPAPSAADEQPGSSNALLGYIVAFSLGYFPTLAVSWFARVANKALGEPTRRSDSQRLVMVDGISVFHEERLLEEGIQNVHDLAFADVPTLLVKTPYTTDQLLDWSNQCALLLFLDPGEVAVFRRGGIRTASDLLAVWPAGSLGTAATEPQQNLARALQTTPERLHSISASLRARHATTQENPPPAAKHPTGDADPKGPEAVPG